MPTTRRPADQRRRITFSKRLLQADDYGNLQTTPFVDQFTLWARVRFLTGNESVIAERLAGHQPAVLTVSRTAKSVQIQTEWRAVDLHDATLVFNVRAVTPDELNRAIDLLCEAGVPV
jgi:SPP1 family predicted phage head-tail adaptor